MRMMRLVLPLLLSLWAMPAFAVCTGQFLGGQVCNNNTTSTGIPNPESNIVLGIPGTTAGSIALSGLTSGQVTITPQVTAGSATLLLPTTTGTLASSATSPLILNAITGVLTCPTCVVGAGGALINGTTPTTGYSNTQILSSNGSVLAAYSVSGSGNVVLTTSPSITTPSITTPSITTPTINTNILFPGSSSGSVTITSQATAGTPTLTLPNTTGTFAVNASSPLILSLTTGGLTCPTCVTSSGGGAITGSAPISVSGAGVVSINAPYTSLTASNGGIVYSGATNLAILAGTATANQMLQSGASTTPAWSTSTWPATTSINQILYSSSANTVAGLSTANNSVLVTNGTGVPSLSTTLPTVSIPAISGAVSITSNSSTALTVGPNGATNPVLQINASTASQAAGLHILGGAAGNGTSVSVIDSATNSPLSLNAKGSGQIGIGNVSTGGIIIGGAGAGVTIGSGGLTTPTIVINGSAIASIGTGVPAALAVNTGSVGAFQTIIAQGTLALSTTAISSGACTAAQTSTATGTLTTDVVLASFNGDPTGTTGYIPSSAGMLTIVVYPTANTFNAKVCNNTNSSITPGAITLNWRVAR